MTHPILIRRAIIAAALAALAACAPAPPAPQTKAAAPASAAGLPAGQYELDPAHASLLFRVDHISFSHYTARFAHWNATLTLDPANPGVAAVTATVDPRSLSVNTPPAGFLDQLLGPQWLDAAQFPQMKFESTQVAMLSADRARVTGDFTLHGVTRPVTLEVKFNGGYAGNPYEPRARIGFSAHGALKRSDFGVDIGLPPPGSTLGVGDEVEIIIEAEFTGPPWAGAPTPKE
jgi:polyisoprenoid-binding protein YceI